MSCFSQFVTSSARLDTVSLKSIKRILGGVHLERTNAWLLPKSWWLHMTGVSKILCLMRGHCLSLWIHSSSLEPCPKNTETILLMWKYSFDIYQNEMHLHLKDIKLCKKQSVVPRGNILAHTSRTVVIKNTTPDNTTIWIKKKCFPF